MAFANRPSAQLTFGMIDGRGNRGSMQFDVPYGTLAAVAIAGGEVLRDLIAAMTGCTIKSQTLTYSEVDNNYADPQLTSRVERKGTFHFMTAQGKIVHYSVPSFLFSLEKSNGAVNEDWPTVQAFVNGVVAAGALFCDSNGVDLTRYVGAREISRRTTKGEKPNDYRPDADIVP